MFINYIDHRRPHLFARPTSCAISSQIDAMFDFLPNGNRSWSVLDHSNGLVLTDDILWGREICVCNPATQRWTMVPRPPVKDRPSTIYLAFDPSTTPEYNVFVIPPLPEKKEQQEESVEAERFLVEDWSVGGQGLCPPGRACRNSSGHAFGWLEAVIQWATPALRCVLARSALRALQRLFRHKVPPLIFKSHAPKAS